MKRYIGLFAVGALVVAGSATQAVAQPASDEWNVLVTPYLMVTSMSGTTTVRGVTVDVDVFSSDIFANLQFGAMGTVVARLQAAADRRVPVRLCTGAGAFCAGSDLTWQLRPTLSLKLTDNASLDFGY